MRNKLLLAAFAFGVFAGMSHSQVLATFLQGSTAAVCPFVTGLTADTVQAMYSFDRLSPTYTGFAVQLRRASDSTTLDVGFSGCGFNTTAAATFCVSTTCFGAKWYDQINGSTQVITNATTSQQPQYIASCQNSKPCFQFAQASSQNLKGTLSTGLTVNTFAAVTSMSTTASTYYVVALGSGSTGTGIGYTVASGGAPHDTRIVSSVATRATKSGYVFGTWVTLGGTNTNTLGRVFVSNIAGTDDTASKTLGTTSTITVGGQNGAASNVAGSVAEVILFAANISDGNYGIISANQATRWNVAH